MGKIKPHRTTTEAQKKEPRSKKESRIFCEMERDFLLE
jgi:hypothetical protein